MNEMVESATILNWQRGSFPLQRVKQLLVPARDWGPALVQHRQLIKHVPGFIVDPEDWNHGVSFTYQNISEEPTLIMHGLTVLYLFW